MLLPTDRPILVTGSAGFIGFHVAERLLKAGHAVTGIDNHVRSYDPALKQARIDRLSAQPHFHYTRGDLADAATTRSFFAAKPDFVIHAAAQSGVRQSLSQPEPYVTANLVGFFQVLEAAFRHSVRHFVYSSSSAVYGANARLPFSVHDPVAHPISLYGATKRANELMAHSYSHLYALPTTALRFFTVYGPWGRPDMAVYRFTAAILAGEPIELADRGEIERDFTFINDAVEAVILAAGRVPEGQPASADATPAGSTAPFRVLNVASGRPVTLNDVIRLIEKETGKRANIVQRERPAGDMERTAASVDDLEAVTGFRPSTSIEEGIRRFVTWYRNHYGV